MRHTLKWITLLAFLHTPALADLKLLAQKNVQAFIQKVSKEGLYSQKELTDLFDAVVPQKRVLTLAKRSYKNKLWNPYRKQFINPQHIKAGLSFWHTHQTTLQKAEKTYGVPASIIVAILGIETHYGKQTGHHRVIDGLSTLAFMRPHRSAYFTKELKTFLQLTHDLHLDPLKVTGSFDGGMGWPQFMPSSYQAYAVDASGHDRPDLQNNIDDVIFSIANYLKENGWRKGAPLVTQTHVLGTQYATLLSKARHAEFHPKLLEKFGFEPFHPLPKHERFTPFSWESEHGVYQYWLAGDNFYVLMRYNSHHLYALAACELAKTIEMQWRTEKHSASHAHSSTATKALSANAKKKAPHPKGKSHTAR